jgi:hypothetical protein
MTQHNINFSGASIGAVNVDSTVEGPQIGTQYNYDSNAEDIARLISALHEQIQTFPSEQKREAVELLEGIRSDLSEPKPKPNRIGQQLKHLAALAAAVGATASGMAAFTGDLNDFSRNFIDLAETIGIPVEQVAPKQPSSPNTPQPILLEDYSD